MACLSPKSPRYLSYSRVEGFYTTTIMIGISIPHIGAGDRLGKVWADYPDPAAMLKPLAQASRPSSPKRRKTRKPKSTISASTFLGGGVS